MYCLILILTSLITITCIFHHNDINVNNAYAEQGDKNNRKNVIVTIPKGSANPEVDITN